MSNQTFGRYTLSEKLGHGGMSVVHRAFDPRLERNVAIKILHPHLAERADSRARFSREARAVARLRHPNIVEVFDYASPQSQDSFIVTEYVDGPTLRIFAEEHAIKHPEAALLLMVPIIDALDRAHEAGIVHRDVKPENIMIRADGSPVLLDFGIAQMIDMPTLTATGTMLGSPAHMAPEVIDGKPVGAPADIFSVGTTLYWLICGTLPFSGPNPSALFRRILEADFDPVLIRRPRAGRQLARVIERCLAREPSERPTSTELRQSLTALLTSMDITDLKSEQAQFASDPERYQDNLSERLVPALTALAQERLDSAKTALALDVLDRALELNPSDAKALSLINGIERARRTKERIQMLLLVFCGLLPIGVGMWAYSAYVSNSSATQTQAIQAAASKPKQASIAKLPAPGIALDAFIGAPDDASPSNTALNASTSAPIADAATAVDATATAPDLAIEIVNDARVKSPPPTTRRTKTRSRRSIDGSKTPVQSRKRQQAQADAGTDLIKPTKKTVRVRVHSALKGAMVFVDNQATPQPLYRLEVAGGIALSEGSHTVRFVNPGCAEEARSVTISPGQLAAAPLVFKCRPLPSTIRIACSPPSLEIRQADTGRLLGQTNQDISIPMTALRSRIALTIGTPGGRFAKRVVDVQAGQRSTVLRLNNDDLKP